MRLRIIHMQTKALASLFLLLFLAGMAYCDIGDPRKAVFPNPEFKPPQAKVYNDSKGGPTVILLEDHEIPLVRLSLTFRGGSVNDPAGKAGLFSLTGSAWDMGGTKSLPPALLEEKLEANAIELGVGVGRESGSVSFSCLSSDFDLALGLAEELVFNPGFDGERWELAKNLAIDAIVREEESPEAVAYRNLRRALYPGHPRGISPTVESVGAATLDEARALQGQIVAQSEWIISAVGDFDADKLAQNLSARFAALKGKSDSFKMPAPKPLEESKVVLVQKPLKQTTIIWARFAPDILDSARADLEIADYLLGGGGFQSRLNRVIREEQGLAYSVGSFYDAYPGFGVMGLSLATSTETTLKAWKIAAQEVAAFAKGSVTAEEVESAKSAVINSNIFRFRDPADTVAERVTLLLKGLPEDLTERFFAAIAKTDAKSVGEAAQKHYATKPGVWVLVGDVKKLAEDAKEFGQVEIQDKKD